MTIPPRSGAARTAALGGGVIFAASLLYFAWAYGRRYAVVADASTDATTATLINVGLFSAFALHHSVLARSGIKARLTRVFLGAPPAVERTAYVWIASVLFILVCAAWQPVPGTVWLVTGPAAWLLHAVQIGGALIAIGAGRVIDIFELAGVREALGRPSAKRDSDTPTARGPFGFVRHPLYLAFLLAVWPMPLMTGTRFVFALVSTVYVLIAIPMEERDLRRTFGRGYEDYSGRVRYRLVPGVYEEHDSQTLTSGLQVWQRDQVGLTKAGWGLRQIESRLSASSQAGNRLLRPLGLRTSPPRQSQL